MRPGPQVKFYTAHRFDTVRNDTDNYASDCTSITFKNKGNAIAYLESADSTYELEPGESVSFNNQADTFTTTFFDRIYFAEGTKKAVSVIREYVTTEQPVKKVTQ